MTEGDDDGTTDGLTVLVALVRALSEDLDLERTLLRVVEAARRLVAAPYGALGVLADDGRSLSRFVHAGIDEATAARIGPLPTGRGVLGEVIRHPVPLRLADVTDHPSSVELPAGHPPMGSFLGVPVRTGAVVFGNLYVAGRPAGFDDDDEDRLLALAAVAGAAIRSARAATELADAARVGAVRAERDRIARDIHDTVIQRLFGAGLRLDALGRTLDQRGAATVEEVIGEVDGAIAELRTTIAALDRPVDADASTRLRAVVEALRATCPQLRPLDLEGDPAGLPDAVVEDLVAVVREGVTNAARHATPTVVRAHVAVGPTTVVAVVQDDGTGILAGAAPSPGHGRGVANLRARAERHGGTCTLDDRSGGGATLRWSVPRPD